MAANERVRLRFIRDEAIGYLLLDMPEHALKTLDRGGENPTAFTAEFFCLRGQSLQQLKRYREAIPIWEEASEIDPDDVGPHLGLGWCYKRTGRVDLAIEALERARKLEPGNALVLYNLACYWTLQRNKEVALHFLAQAFQIDESYKQLVDEETDFDYLRDDPEFRTLVSIIV